MRTCSDVSQCTCNHIHAYAACAFLKIICVECAAVECTFVHNYGIIR